MASVPLRPDHSRGQPWAGHRRVWLVGGTASARTATDSPSAGARHLRRRAAGNHRCGTLLREFGVDAVWLGSGASRPSGWPCCGGRACRSTRSSTRCTWPIPQGAPRRRPDRHRRRVAATQRLAGHLPDPRGLPHAGWTLQETLQQFAIDGVWLDYHHAHASGNRLNRKCPTPASAIVASAIPEGHGNRPA